MHRPGTELATSRSRVRRPTTTLTEQPVDQNTMQLNLDKLASHSAVVAVAVTGCVVGW